VRALLDAFPFPWAEPDAQELHLTLVVLYPNERDATSLAERAGLATYELSQGLAPIYLWREILDLGAQMALTRKMVELALAQHRNNVRASFLGALLARSSAE
jgi:hypothetical protein